MSMHFCAWCSEEGEAVKRKKNTFTDERGILPPFQGGAVSLPAEPPRPPGFPTAPLGSQKGKDARFLCEKTPGVRVPGLQTPAGPEGATSAGRASHRAPHMQEAPGPALFALSSSASGMLRILHVSEFGLFSFVETYFT